MIAIFKRRLHFRNPDGIKAHDVVFGPSAEPITAPDWVRNTYAWQMASKDKVAIEVVLPPAPKVEQVDEDPKKSESEDDDLGMDDKKSPKAKSAK